MLGQVGKLFGRSWGHTVGDVGNCVVSHELASRKCAVAASGNVTGGGLGASATSPCRFPADTGKAGSQAIV
eukprot:5976512-Amphidinium_carterae.1